MAGETDYIAPYLKDGSIPAGATTDTLRDAYIGLEHDPDTPVSAGGAAVVAASVILDALADPDSDITGAVAAVAAGAVPAAPEYEDYTPVVGGGGVTIDIGADGSITGRSVRNGNMVTGWWHLSIAGDGAAATGGPFSVSLPYDVAAASGGPLGPAYIGTGFFYDGTTTRPIYGYIDLGSGVDVARFVGADGTALTAGDLLDGATSSVHLAFSYEAEPEA